MSNPLQVLLERITPKPEPIPEPKPPSKQQMKLVKRIQNRRWMEHAIPLTEERLAEAHRELDSIDHMTNCSECLTELQLSVERYLGRRSPWYIDISEGVDFADEIWETRPDYYKDCPRATDYELGYYGHRSDETLRFIKDRFEWAKKTYEQEIQVIKTFLEALKNWDLESELPAESIFNIY